MTPLVLASMVGSAFVSSAALTGLLIRFLVARNILDHPGTRTSHEVPTPRGGGLAIYTVLMAGWGVAAMVLPTRPVELAWIMGCSLVLALVSWADDVAPLPAFPRLLLQITVAGVGTYFLGGRYDVFQGYLPPAADAAATVFLWVAFINLFNFTDGIDGNAGTKATVLGVGVFLLAFLGEIPESLGVLGMIVAGATAGFLVWNWHPAKIFMGDVGSVTLGYLLAWLLLRTAADGLWGPAIILPMIYLFDSGITYMWKFIRREPFWRTHRDHYYQHAVRREGVTHSQVVQIVLLGDVILIAMAIWAARGHLGVAMFGAVATALAVIAVLGRGSEPGPES